MRRFFYGFLTIFRKKSIIPKLISLLLAVVLWGYLLSHNRGNELQFRIAIAAENLPRNMVITEFSNKFVTVAVSGRADLLKNIQSNNIKAVVDLRDPKIGSAQYPISIIRNEVPDSLNVSPRQNMVEIYIETHESKMLKVIPVIIGSVANGFSMGPVRVTPDTIKVTGPASVLGKLTKVDTQAISVIGAENDIIMNVNIKKQQSELFELDLNTVQVVIPVAKEGVFLNFTLPVKIENATRYEASLTDTKAAVVYMKNNMAAAITDDINARAVIYLDSANTEGLMKNSKEVVQKFPISVVYDKNAYNNLEILSVAPEEASVSISIKQ
ncbi:MAG: CdaR family protein [Leptospirales bacterium]|nr:CdaR family protein [Leptospirales bacterium]